MPDESMALNEAVENIRRLIELQRRYSAPQTPDGQALLMEPTYGLGLPPMIQSVAQPDR